MICRVAMALAVIVATAESPRSAVAVEPWADPGLPVTQGLVLAVPYSDRPPRLEYRITEAGRELAGALRLLARWGSRESGAEVEGPHHRSCGTALETRWFCPTCARVTDTADDDLRWL